MNITNNKRRPAKDKRERQTKGEAKNEREREGVRERCRWEHMQRQRTGKPTKEKSERKNT